MRINKKLLLIIFLVGAMFMVGTIAAPRLASVGVGGAWNLQMGFSKLSVNGVSLNAADPSLITLDPDDVRLASIANPGAPEIKAGFGTSFRVAPVDPRDAGEYIAYMYEIDIYFKTFAKQVIAGYYESDEATCALYFDVGIASTDVSDVSEGALISDVFVETASQGLTAYPLMTSAEIEMMFNEGVDPAANVHPSIRHMVAIGEGLIVSGAATDTASCAIGVKLRAGGLMVWSPLYGIPFFPAIYDVDIFDVFAQYTIRVEVLVPRGEDPPLTNPFQIFLQILQDLQFRTKDVFERLFEWLTVWAPIIFTIIVGLVVFYIIMKTRRKR